MESEYLRVFRQKARRFSPLTGEFMARRALFIYGPLVLGVVDKKIESAPTARALI